MGVLIAGGTGALGSAVVRELLDSGYDCTVTWIAERELERARSELGERASFVRADLVDPGGGAEEAVGAVDDLEAVVDLVGGFASGPLVHETDWSEFERMLRLNLAPAFNLAHAAMPRLVERGGGALQRMELGLASSPFLVGDSLTLADVALVAYTRVAHEGGFSLDLYPAVKAWVARVEGVLKIA